MSRKAPRVIHALGQTEFIILMALMTALMALTIDGMLPALPKIGADLGVKIANDTQHIITMIFIGFGAGQLIYGPLSDTFGRKPPIYWGILVYIIGCLVSAFSTDLNMMLVGRFLQGFGAAAPRIVSIALIRDEYEGNAMARIMSLVMTVFIIVPALAPTLGKGILLFASWRAIFALLLFLAVVVLFWFSARQPESLPKEKRKPFNFKQLQYGAAQVFASRQAVVCMSVSGLIFGAFMGYLSSCYQIFDLFGEGERFHLYFGALALSLGLASVTNSKLVMKIGMSRLVRTAILAITLLAAAFYIYLTVRDFAQPPLWLFVTYLLVSFFFIGILFGNLNAMAMQPLGHVAGIGSAIVGSIQSIISVVIGMAIGHAFNGSVTPMVVGFSTLGFLSFMLMHFGLKKKVVKEPDIPPEESGMSDPTH